MQILTFALQPEDTYNMAPAPRRELLLTNHAWLVYLFTGDERGLQKFATQVRGELQSQPTVWRGLGLKEYVHHDLYGPIFIVDCNLCLYLSIAEPLRLFDQLVRHIGGSRIIG